MLTLRGLATLLIKSTNALLQAKQGLVDLSSFSLSVLVVALTVLCSFTSGQVDEKKFAAMVDSLLLNFDLCDGVTSAGSVVSLRSMRCSHLVALFDQVEDLVIVVNKLLFKASNLNRICFILPELQFVMLVEQIVHFAAVDLVHRHCDGEVPLVILPVIDAAFEEIFDGDALNSIHRVRLAGSRLTVSKYGYYSLIEN